MLNTLKKKCWKYCLSPNKQKKKTIALWMKWHQNDRMLELLVIFVVFHSLKIAWFALSILKGQFKVPELCMQYYNIWMLSTIDHNNLVGLLHLINHEMINFSNSKCVEFELTKINNNKMELKIYLISALQMLIGVEEYNDHDQCCVERAPKNWFEFFLRLCKCSQ